MTTTESQMLCVVEPTNLSAADLMQALPEALVAINRGDRLVFVNAEAEFLLRVDAADAVGRHWSQVMRLFELGADQQEAPLDLALHTLISDDQKVRHLLLRRPDGTERVIQVRPASLSQQSSETLLLIHDCTDTYSRLRQLEWQCSHDHLTKLVNRREFERRLRRVLRQVAGEATSQHVLMLMDLDGFKPINDRHGHLAGDAVLREVARLLGSQVRERDTLARLGGDEFGLLMEHCTAQEGWRVASALRDVLRQRRFGGSAAFQVCLSIGMVTLDHTSNELAKVLATADKACYQAKRSGGDQVHFYRSDSAIGSDYTPLARYIRIS